MQSLIPESLRLMVVGLNHRTAPLSVRERIAVPAEKLPALLTALHQQFPTAEIVLLSTCNRIEAYLARPLREGPSLEQIAAFLAQIGDISPAELTPHIYHHEDRAAVEHLFHVAASLDSMVVGETQILSQVKSAYQAACAVSTAGKIFHTLFQRVLAAAKDVHDSTTLSAGRLSVASVAVELVQSVFDRFDDKTVVCLGAGKMAAMMLRHLRDLSPQRLLIGNRSVDRAREIAATFAGEPHDLAALDDLLIAADIVLTSTGTPEPIIREQAFRSVVKRRRYRPLVIVDIAVPRDVEPSVANSPNVYLYNIDDLQEIAAGNKAKRSESIAAAQKVLAAAVEDFLKWFAARDVGPLVKALYEQCHAYAQAEFEAALARRPEMSEQERAELQRLTHRLVGKILHGPVTELTTHAEATARPMLTAALRKLFNLTPDSSKTPPSNE